MLTKEELLQPLAELRRDEVVITTMGLVRPWARFSRHSLDFASADSAMGHAADFAIGLALAQPHRRILCLNGDGSMLMTLGSLVTAVEAKAENLILFVVRNDRYEVTGNQPVPGAGCVNFLEMARGAGFGALYHFQNASDYRKRLPEVLRTPGPVFVLVEVMEGSEGPLSRGPANPEAYLQPSLAESAHRLRQILVSRPGIEPGTY